MKTVKQINKEIELLQDKRANREAMSDLARLKSPGMRSKIDSSIVDFWRDGDDDFACEIYLNKKESELLRRFLYAMKKRAVNGN